MSLAHRAEESLSEAPFRPGHENRRTSPSALRPKTEISLKTVLTKNTVFLPEGCFLMAKTSSLFSLLHLYECCYFSFFGPPACFLLASHLFPLADLFPSPLYTLPCSCIFMTEFILIMKTYNSKLLQLKGLTSLLKPTIMNK